MGMRLWFRIASAPAARLTLPQVNIQLITVFTTYRWNVFVVSSNALIEQHVALTSLKRTYQANLDLDG